MVLRNGCGVAVVEEDAIVGSGFEIEKLNFKPVIREII
jgi:hypothetical protein